MFVSEFVDAIDHRSRLSPIRDQGERGTCVAFATTAGNELLRRPDIDLSEEFLYWSCKQRDGFPGEGTNMVTAIVALQEVGQPLEQYFPYISHCSCVPGDYKPSAHAFTNALEFRIANGQRHPLRVGELQRRLIQGQAVVLVLRLHPSFYRTSGGSIPRPEREDYDLGAHAVLVVGYHGKVTESEGYFILRNSWGEEWGDSGYGYLPYAYFEELALEIWTFTINARRLKGVIQTNTG